MKFVCGQTVTVLATSAVMIKLRNSRCDYQKHQSSSSSRVLVHGKRHGLGRSLVKLDLTGASLQLSVTDTKMLVISSSHNFDPEAIVELSKEIFGSSHL